jgi:hypothetical protein
VLRRSDHEVETFHQQASWILWVYSNDRRQIPIFLHSISTSDVIIQDGHRVNMQCTFTCANILARLLY